MFQESTRKKSPITSSKTEFVEKKKNSQQTKVQDQKASQGNSNKDIKKG